MRTGSCRRNPPGSSRSSPTAWWTTCWIEGTRAVSLLPSLETRAAHAPQERAVQSRRSIPRGARRRRAFRRVLLHAEPKPHFTLLQRQRDEAQFAFRVGHEQERRLAALLLQRVDALLHRVGVAHRLLRHLDDDVARAQALLGGGGAAFDAGDHHALHAVLDLVALAQVFGQVGQIETERLLDDGFVLVLVVGLGRSLHLLGVLEAAELDRLALFLALADDHHRHVLAHRRVGDDARQVLHLLDVLAVELDDDIAGLDAGRLGRPLVIDARHQRAARGFEPEAFGDVVGDLLDAHAEPAAAHLAELAQLIDDGDRVLGRDRKADADRAARWRVDRRVDADDLAVHVEQRAAGIAAVDRGIGLDVAVVGPGIDVAVARRDDAGRHRAAQPERITDRNHPFADAQDFGIAEAH